MNINNAMNRGCPFKCGTCSCSCMAWEWINEEDVDGRCMLIPIPEEARGMPEIAYRGTLQTRIQQKLEELRMTRHKLAKEVGMNRPKVYEVAAGFQRATPSYQQRIASVLSMTTEDLFNEYGMARIVREDENNGTAKNQNVV